MSKLIYTLSDINHTGLSVYQTSNSFGDQKLEYVLELKDGSKFSKFEMNNEGRWLTESYEFKDWALVHFRDHKEYINSLK